MNQPSYYAVIPATVRYAKISPNAKLLYGEISALANKEGCCWATNSYFSRLYEVDTRTIRRWLSELKKKQFIAIVDSIADKNVRGGADKNVTRFLYINNTSNNISQTVKTVASKHMRKIKENAFDSDYEDVVDLEGRPLKKPAPTAKKSQKESARLLIESKQLLDYYRELYMERISDTEPLINEERYKGQVKVFLKKLGLEKLKELCEIYLSTKDAFYRDNVWSINVFLSYDTLNKLNIKK